MADDGDAHRLLLADFDQAWAHYRHVETMRTQYLGFFFTISLGSAALAIPVISAGSFDDASRLASFATFLWVYSVVASFIYLSVRRAGPVLAHYEAVMRVLRKRWHSSPEDAELLTLLDVRAQLSPLGQPAIVSVQQSAEWVVRFFLVLVVAALAMLVVQAGRLDSSVLVVGGIALAAGSSLAMAVGVSLISRTGRGRA